MSEESTTRRDSQPPDLVRERDEVLRSFPQGSRIAEDLGHELDGLRSRIRDLELDNARLRAKVEADDAVRELLARIERLEAEKRELLSRFEKAEQASSKHTERFEQIEAEFADMATLYVASNQLHSSLSPRRVTRRIKEVLAQLVGAERYCMYFATPDGAELVPIAYEGVGTAELVPVRIAGSRMGHAYANNEVLCDEQADPSRGTAEVPAAVIPLCLDETVVGVIAIFATLAQKTAFCNVDFELFRLLQQHAAGALISAGMFVQNGRKMPGLEVFLDLSV
jgi:hypothetical protein